MSNYVAEAKCHISSSNSEFKRVIFTLRSGDLIDRDKSTRLANLAHLRLVQRKLLQISKLYVNFDFRRCGSALAIGGICKADHDESHRTDSRGSLPGENRSRCQCRDRGGRDAGSSRTFLGLGGSACFPPILTGGTNR